MRAIGIDLGTTNSVATYCDGPEGSPRVLRNAFGEKSTPSVVNVRTRRGSPGPVTVGRAAVEQAGFAPADTIVSVKRLMGRTIDDEKIALIRDRFAYRVVAGEADDPRAHVRMGGTSYLPEQISAHILDTIRQDSARELDEAATHAVITVPAYFSNAQRTATREAGVAAGLEVLKVIDEPTAAAVAFGAGGAAGENHMTLVYDLGGGTFDISLLAHRRDADTGADYTVLDVDGDTWLGGDDFDAAIVDRIVESVQAEHGIDPGDDPQFRWAVKQAAERAKKTLSQVDEAGIDLPSVYNPPGGPAVDVETTIRRAEFEQMIEPFVDRTMELVSKLLAHWSISPDMVTDVLLVGGATLTPLVYRRVERYFGRSKVRRDIDPMDVVAIGAGLIARSMGGVACPSCGVQNRDGRADCQECGHELPVRSSATRLNELSVHSIGIASVRGADRDAFATIIPKATRLPLQERYARTFRSSGRRVHLPIYEGEYDRASANSLQGSVDYTLPDDVDAEVVLDVEFDYNDDKILEVTITVPGTSVQATRQVDPERRPLPPPPPRDLRTELENVVETANVMIKNYGGYLEAEQRRRLEASVRAARMVLDEDPSERAFRRALDALDSDLSGCGVAAQLFLADRVVAVGLSAELAERIQAERRLIDEALRRGDQAEMQDRARSLRVEIGKARDSLEGTERSTAEQDGLVNQIDDDRDR